MKARERQEGGKIKRNLNEIVGLGFFLMAALAFLALLSYTVKDPSPNTAVIPPTEPTNLAGRLGSYTADQLVQLGGYASVLVPIVLAVIGVFFFTGRQVKMRAGQFIGYLLLLATLAAILSMVLPESDGRFSGGGEVGGVLADWLRLGVGKVGGLLVALALLVVSLIATIDFSFVRVGGWLGRIAASAGQSLVAWWTVRREQSRRRQRRDQKEGPVKSPREAPIIRLGKGEKEEARPAAVEAKPAKKRDTSVPVRTTRLPDESLIAPPVKQQPAVRPQPPVEAPAAAPEPAFIETVKAEKSAAASETPAAPLKPKEKAPAPLKRVEHDQVTIHEQAETEAARQISFSGLAGQYQPPPLKLFKTNENLDEELDREALLAQSITLESKLETFGVTGHVVEIHPGPVITMFEYEPSPGIKVSRIANLDDDLAMALQAEKIRIIAPIPGKGAVGIEIPSLRRQIVYLREILESKEFNEAKSPLTVAFGKNSRGGPFVEDLTKMPHLLVAGTTGSGKSVFLNAVIMSLMYKSTPEQVRLLMVDPKQLELAMYTDCPHMLHPVIVEPKKAAVMLRWAVAEMEDRYRKLAEIGVRNIDSYNKKVEKMLAKTPRRGTLTGDDAPDMPEPLPYIVLIIDELADLMMIAAKEVEESIARLAQMARAAGIHLILATQRPSVDVITGVIKANFPSRISFQVRSRIDSRTILDEGGANNLLGWGDGLFLPPGTAKLTRFHAAFISDDEVHAAVDYLKQKHAPPDYVEIRTTAGDDLQDANIDNISLGDDEGDDDGLFDKAIQIVARDRKASVSYIQRRLKIGYNRAARIIERMEQEGLISQSDGTSRPREIYIPERDYD
ncbi:MAG TPA: DNA translocase FtsK 4TM domain-containing protein [bacterium]|nr:DNA translocase FtsK 4TM domain-containing protein [bacterium]